MEWHSRFCLLELLRDILNINTWNTGGLKQKFVTIDGMLVGS
jgi:hypothetical protein